MRTDRCRREWAVVLEKVRPRPDRLNLALAEACAPVLGTAVMIRSRTIGSPKERFQGKMGSCCVEAVEVGGERSTGMRVAGV